MEPVETEIATELGAFLDGHPVATICDLLDQPFGDNATAFLFRLACSDSLPEAIVGLARRLYLQSSPVGLNHLTIDFSPSSVMRH